METIIIATDFSQAAQNAANYALQLATVLEVDIKLVHSYSIPYVSGEPSSTLLGVEELAKIAQDNLSNEKERLLKMDATKSIETIVLVGDIIDSIDNLIQEFDPLLVVFGASGSSDAFLWGSIAIKAIRIINAPVLLIPKEYIYKEITNISLAADLSQLIGNCPLQQIQFWKKKLAAQLEIVHIIHDKNKNEPSIRGTKTIVDVLSANYKEVVNTNVQLAVRSYLADNEVDWIIVVPKKYNFWEDVFRTSRSKIIAKTSKIPILAIKMI